MKRFALSLIMLTQLNGSPVWVEAHQIQIVREHSKECGHGAGSVIKVLSTTLCIKETADQVREKIKSNGR